MDVREFAKNTSAHTAEELAPYEDQHVAWSEDGRQILAHAAELAELYRLLDSKSITRYVIGCIPPFDES